jgi:SAM-dependent methyltransferase
MKQDDKLDEARKDHWEKVYAGKASTQVSWYQQNPRLSLNMIRETGVTPSQRIIDIGGGASTLVDHLLDAGFQDISVLDIAHGAIEQAKARLGQRANQVTWLESDVTGFRPEQPYAVWHDRAVFHFLTDPLDRSAYVHSMAGALQPGSYAIIATFDLEGPEQCSGLDIVRYSPETLAAVLGDEFRLVKTSSEDHLTPSNAVQKFIYCRFTRVAP